jgi:hypothetical protein
MRKIKSEIALFNEEARNRGMTYGKLQTLETCGKIKVVNGKVKEVKK